MSVNIFSLAVAGLDVDSGVIGGVDSSEECLEGGVYVARAGSASKTLASELASQGLCCRAEIEKRAL